MKFENSSIDILGSDGKYINIPLENVEIQNHFLHPESHIGIIVDKQINTDKMYDFYFKDKKDLTVIDAGANVGTFSVHCSPSSKIIYSIEPTPSHFNILKQITSNFKNIIPINCALWSKDENLTFYLYTNTTSNSAIHSTGQPITVIGKKLQTIITENNIEHIDLVKMDIEGSEFEVLTPECIEYCYPIIDNWIIEVHVLPRSGLSNFSECREKLIDIFSSNNYKIDTQEIDRLFIYK